MKEKIGRFAKQTTDPLAAKSGQIRLNQAGKFTFRK
jgi:hypothetical protein